MNSTANNFMKAAVIYALTGLVLGVIMAASHDFGMRSVHAHLSLLGWTTMAIFALYYQFVPHAADTGAAKIHFWLANIGLVSLTTSVGLIVQGIAIAEAGAAAGSIVLLVSMLLFAFIVFTAKEHGQVKQRAGFFRHAVFSNEQP